MEEIYDLILEYFYFDLAKLKESQIYQIKSILSGCRLGEKMNFSSYGKAYFNSQDHKHSHLFVEPINEYDKSKVNCLIYDLKYDCQNMGYFDKLFIYMNQLKETYYGYVLYNSKTKHCCQKTLIDPQEDYLINNLTKDFLTLFKKDIYDHFSKKYDAIKNFKTEGVSSIPTIGDYEKMMENHVEKQKIGYY